MKRLSTALMLSAALVTSLAAGAARADAGPPKPGKCSVGAGVGAAGDHGAAAFAGLVGLALAAGATARRRR